MASSTLDSYLIAGVYERTLSVDGEDTTLVVMDTWEAEKLVRHCKHVRGRGAKINIRHLSPSGAYRAGPRAGACLGPPPSNL